MIIPTFCLTLKRIWSLCWDYRKVGNTATFKICVTLDISSVKNAEGNDRNCRAEMRRKNLAPANIYNKDIAESALDNWDINIKNNQYTVGYKDNITYNSLKL